MVKIVEGTGGGGGGAPVNPLLTIQCTIMCSTVKVISTFPLVVISVVMCRYVSTGLTTLHEFKCSFCCSKATRFCWDTTFFCDECHAKSGDLNIARGFAVLGVPIFPQCPVGPGCVQLKLGDPCPMGLTKHAPTGSWVVLGCTMCKSEEVVGVSSSESVPEDKEGMVVKASAESVPEDKEDAVATASPESVPEEI